MDLDYNVLRRINENERRNFIILEEEDDAFMDAFARPRKRRLDHLTWEEKVQRKKLKNRVAAQTSRDRKKAKMEQLEDNFSQLMEQNKRVLEECENLKKLNESIRQENVELRQALRQSCASCQQAQSTVVKCEGHLSGSTESDFLLLQQGVAPRATPTSSCSKRLLALKILLACLLCRTSSTSSTKTSILEAWTSSHKASSLTSPATLMHWIKMLNHKEQLVNPTTLAKWWGRHQNNWNPMEVAVA